jgi:hypothetical protein
MKHLVLVTSVIKPKHSQTVYSEEQRFSQLIDTLKSIEKIPNNMIIVLEGTKYSEIQEQEIKKLSHHIFYVNVDRFNKQYGEVALLGNFFSSVYFNKLKKDYEILSINKISGRYTLTDKFKFYYDGETCVCKLVEPHESYSKFGYIQTRYYSIPAKYLDHFSNNLLKCFQNIFINIEHSFYLHNVIPINKINRNITKINVCGNIAPNGEYVED